MSPPVPVSPLARAVRTSARVALWTSLAVTLLAALALARFARPRPIPEATKIAADQASWLGVDFYSMPEVDLLRKLVAIDTSQPHPDEVAAAEFIAARLAAVGVRAEIERFADRRANLWAILPGDDPKALVLHGHLDVEPLLDNGPWRHPPLGGVIEGPWIFGRGMYDMKSLTAAQLMAFEDVARSGRRLRRSLMLLATSSEELGSDTGTRYLLAERPDVVAHLGTVLTEGGVIEATAPRDVKYWGIEFAQKRFAQFSACSRSRADLEALRDLLVTQGRSAPRPHVSPTVASFLAAYAPSRGLEIYRELLAEPARLPLEMDRYQRLTPFLQSLFRDEVVPFRLELENDGSWRLDLSVHLLPGSDLGAVLAELLPPWTTHGMTLTPPDLRGTSLASPIDSPDFRTLERVIEEHEPGVAVGPYFLPWSATDARYFRGAGIPAYGVSPFPVMASETTRIAMPDERMQLPAYVVGVALYRDLVRALVE
jgi:acetylornithine deacetylase/succinyl-diaminopimelate desuccinylase-like protein